MRAAELTLGPVLYNWAPEAWRDFYFRIADEAPVGAVYLGEVICSKRAPLFEPHLAAAAERLTAAGKTVIFSSLAEVMLKLDRKLIESTCAIDRLVEANDASALRALRGRPHHVGPFMNVYNEETVKFLVGHGARNICLPPEMPGSAIGALSASTAGFDVSLEVQVFGRLPLALSARCYHARAHGRTKDSCLFVCEEDPDGMELKALDGRTFLAINGIQTLSYDYLNLIHALPELRAMGIARFRLSPHTCDMVEVAKVFRDALDGKSSTSEASSRLDALKIPSPFSDGFYRGRPGYTWSADIQ